MDDLTVKFIEFIDEDSDVPIAFSLDCDQLRRLGVTDVQTDGRLSVGSVVSVTCDGPWFGFVGVVRRIRRDASGDGVHCYALVRFAGDVFVVFGVGALDSSSAPEALG